MQAVIYIEQIVRRMLLPRDGGGFFPQVLLDTPRLRPILSAKPSRVYSARRVVLGLYVVRLAAAMTASETVDTFAVLGRSIFKI